MTTQPVGEVLFLAHRMPYPPDRGDRIRSWHILRALSERARVHVGCLIEGEADLAHEPVLARVSASHFLAPRPKTLPIAGMMALVTGLPVSVVAFSSRKLDRWVRKLIATRPIEAIFVFSGQMAQYVPRDFRGRVVMDFVDVDSAKFAAYADGARSLPLRWLYRRENVLLSRYEECVAHRADVSLFVTADERQLFLSRLTDPVGVSVEVMRNGIDADAFSADNRLPAPGLGTGGPHIVFTGQMDYAPNVEAVRFFAEEVMPMIVGRYPDARFHVVGRSPTPEVRALEGRNGTRVTGTVPDVRPWLAGADVVVAPLRIARGVQNKVLEAMAMARAVVLTSGAATGIPAQDGVHFAVADTAAALAARTIELIADPARARAMGIVAQSLVREQANWQCALADLPRVMGWADAA